MAKKKITFEGHEFEYDPKAAKSYSVLKKIACAANNIGGFFEAFEAVFDGHDEEYAALLNDDFNKLGELISAVINSEGGEAKN